jgi:RNA polymerase sigma factor (TIGR02999 family)
MTNLTCMLQDLETGNPPAGVDLLSLVYTELRRVAAAKMARESSAHTLQPTALVHEAWMRLGADRQPAWQNRAHFFAAAAETMRRILIDKARHRRAVRHGGGQVRLNVEDLEIAAANEQDDDQLVAVNEALAKFAVEEPRKAELVKLRYFGGLTLEESAAALDVPEGTAKRWWTYARAWFFRELKN